MKRIINVVVVLILSGCLSITESKRAADLEVTLSAYHTAIRWGRLEELVNYYGTKIFKLSNLNSKTIKVIAYEVRQPPILINDKRAVQVVEIQYVVNDKQLVRTILDKQDWRYNMDKEGWRLYSQFPEFRVE